MASTDLEIEEVENTVKKLIAKGMAKEDVDSDGKSIYTFE
jgi:pimeloyl-CoA synthetase